MRKGQGGERGANVQRLGWGTPLLNTQRLFSAHRLEHHSWITRLKTSQCTAHKVEGEVAKTVAVRGQLYSNAMPPKELPASSVLLTAPSTRTSGTVPVVSGAVRVLSGAAPVLAGYCTSGLRRPPSLCGVAVPSGYYPGTVRVLHRHCQVLSGYCVGAVPLCPVTVPVLSGYVRGRRSQQKHMCISVRLKCA